VIGPRSRARRATVLAGAGLAGLVALSACGPVVPGAAAIVGSERITTSTLHDFVNRALSDPQAQQRFAASSAQRADFERQELGRLVLHRLFRDAVRQEHITITQGDVDAELNTLAKQAGGEKAFVASAAAQGVDKKDLGLYAYDIIATDKLGDKLVADIQVPQAALDAAYQQNIDQYDQVHVAHILVQTKALADQILADVQADPSRFAALARQYSIDTASKDSGGDLGFAGRGAYVKPFSDAVFAAAPGSFIEVQSQYGWHVVHVIARRTLTEQQVKQDLRRTVLQDTIQARLATLMQKIAKQRGVRVSPRYGTWDGKSGAINPPTDQLSKPAPGTPSSQPSLPTG
jgi:foldase protein PrsA